MKRTKLAFVTTFDAREVQNWSGTPYHMARSLAQAGIELEYIGPLRTNFETLRRARGRLQRRVAGAYLYDRDSRVLRGYARQVREQLAGLEVDAVFSPGTVPIAFLDTDLPIIVWTDATFAAMLDYYPSFSGLSKETIRSGHEMERSALARVGAAFYSSAWAARSAVEDYGADPAKVHAIPFGANLEVEPGREEIEALIERRRRDECRLLFIGVEWLRKGGDLALAVASRLVKSGLPTRLTVIGREAPRGLGLEFVDYLGFVAKSTAQGRETITRLLGESHFLCLPSRADCTPVVLCEASAYGVPSLSIRTGGIDSVITNGANGYLYDQPDFVELAAEAVARSMLDYDRVYVPLAKASHEEYRSRLNWTKSVQALIGHTSHLAAGR